MPDFDMDNKILHLTKQEMSANLTAITNLLLHLEKKGVDKEKLNELRIKAHTLKGDTRMMGFKSISEAANSLEDLFEVLVEHTDLTNEDLFKNIYKIVDIIQDAVEKLPRQVSIDISGLLPDLHKEQQPQKTPGIVIFSEEPDETDKNENVQDNTRESPEVSSQETQFVQKEYIRVNLDKVEEFLNLSTRVAEFHGRFDYLYNMLESVSLKINSALDDDALKTKLETILYDFSHELAFYNMLSRQFQTEITKLKLIPLSGIFDIFPRLVRDVAGSTCKQVDFIVRGGTVELDRIIVGKLKDVLIHILRNAVDHGCESAEERKKAGKPPVNMVILKAYNRGDMVVIEVSDDGSGLDIIKIKEKAIQKRLVTHEDASRLSDDEIINFIFNEGFSTSEKGTFSGRGIGMDAVATIVKELNGEIEVVTNPGRGTSFIISVPLINSFLPVILFDVQGTMYAIPSSYVVSGLFVDTNDISQVSEKTGTVHINNMDVVLVDLASFLGIESGDKERDENHRKILVVSHLDEVSGLAVSNVIMEKKMIINKPCSLSAKMPLILGAVMGSEHAIPVLNIPYLFEKLKTNSESPVITKREKTGNLHYKLWQKKILLVEDSQITRMQEKEMLQQQKLYVLETGNGKEALSLLEKESVDLIITDIEMPVMNGIEFITSLKADPAYSKIPIVVVSSYSSYFGQLSELGIKHIMDKGDFKSYRLIEVLKQENII